jgi:hypothetical protein
MKEDQALRVIEEQLDRAFGGVAAPDHFAPAVLRRIRERPVTRLPEILDFIGWVAVLAAALAVLISIAPPVLDAYWIGVLSAAVAIPALWFGMRSLRELAE